MRSENDDRCVVMEQSEAADKTINENHKKLKIAYSRDFLLSVAGLDTCKKLPTGFDSSILCVFVDASKSILDRDTISGGVSKQGIKGTDSDSRRNHGCEHRSLCQNMGHDGLLGSGTLPKVSRSAAGAVVPRSDRNSPHLLNRSSEPYRPPHFNQAAPQSRRENHDSYNDETFGSIEDLSQERESMERNRKDLFELMRKEQKKTIDGNQKELASRHEQNYTSDISILIEDSGKDESLADEIEEAEKSVSLQVLKEISYSDAVETPPGFSGKIEKNPGSGSFSNLPQSKVAEAQYMKRSSSSSKFACWFCEEDNEKPVGDSSSDEKASKNVWTTISDKNEVTEKCVISSSGAVEYWTTEQLYNCSKPPQGILKCEDVEQSILSNVDEKSSTLHQSLSCKTSDIERASEHILSLLKGNSPKDLAVHSRGSSGKVLNSSFDNLSMRYDANYGKNLPLQGISQTGVTKEQSAEALLSPQESIDRITRNVIVGSNHFPLLDGDKVLSPSVDCEGITTSAEQTEAINFENELGVDGLLSTKSELQTERDTKPSPISGQFDSLDEICLPDEDSLITFDDEMMPQYPTFEPEWDMNHLHLIKSRSPANIPEKSASLNVPPGHRGSMMLDVKCPPFIYSSYDTMGRESPYINPHEKKLYQFSHQPEVNLRKPFFYPFDSHQTPLTSQTKPKTPIPYLQSPPLYYNSPRNVLPHHFQNTHHEPTRFDLVQDSLLQRMHGARGSPRLSNRLSGGVPVNNPINHNARYLQELNQLQYFSLNHSQPNYAGRGTANLDSLAAGSNQMAFNRLMGMELQAKRMQSLSMSGNAQEMFGDRSELDFGMESRPPWYNRWG